jgi:hypothetical protein
MVLDFWQTSWQAILRLAIPDTLEKETEPDVPVGRWSEDFRNGVFLGAGGGRGIAMAKEKKRPSWEEQQEKQQEKAKQKALAEIEPEEYRKFLDGIFDLVGLDGLERDQISVDWTTGGQYGGSCWDDGKSSHYACDAEPEPDFDVLDKVLERLWPEISFIQYKGLSRDLITRSEDRSNDYYGNYTDYAKKTIKLRALYDRLVKAGKVG